MKPLYQALNRLHCGIWKRMKFAYSNAYWCVESEGVRWVVEGKYSEISNVNYMNPGDYYEVKDE